MRELGTLVSKALRSIDALGRWGGEEFVVVLPEIDADGAMAIAERVRKTVAAHLFAATAETRLTISVGVASYPRDGTTRGELLDAADRAMYAAKWLGRNQTFSADDELVTSIESADGTMSVPDERAMMGAVEALALLVDARDKDTSEHSTKVARLSQRMALALGFTTEHARRVYLAAKLHDIGKVAVADAILHKSGPLTREEWRSMCKHPTIGADVVERIGRLADLAPIIRAHHERYDGSGYPNGLSGENIPLEARILAAADAFDAMVSDRPHRKRMSVDRARGELHRGAGAQFDPEVVAVLDGVLEAEGLAYATGSPRPRNASTVG